MQGIFSLRQQGLFLGKILITGRGLEMRENSIGINPDDGQRNADERIW